MSETGPWRRAADAMLTACQHDPRARWARHDDRSENRTLARRTHSAAMNRKLAICTECGSFP